MALTTLSTTFLIGLLITALYRGLVTALQPASQELPAPVTVSATSGSNNSSTPSPENAPGNPSQGGNRPTPVVIIFADIFDRMDSVIDAATATVWPSFARLFTFKFDWSPETMEHLASSIVAALPRFAYARSANTAFSYEETPQAALLAQAEAVTHKPLSFASSPSLPGTIASPWWTDFAHLIYWFYFVATFTTVAFLWYLYDLKVRRVETAHPIRETRGFSRAQTGDLVTAVLPLTWSATMVMHASTHSINFDENTAGTVFSLTVIAYQWGWNYYFPRDIIAQFEAAPRVVGRGRIVSFEPTPVETLTPSHLDSWALRATIGSRHGSRAGRLNTSPALPLVLPTDVPTGTFTNAQLSSGVQSWRKTLSAVLNDLGTAPYAPAKLTDQSLAPLSSMLGLETSTLFRAKPSVYIAGSRLTLVHNHFAPLTAITNVKEFAWVTRNFFTQTSADVQTRATRSLLTVPTAPALPQLGNLAMADKTPLATEPVEGVNLAFLRSPRKPSLQHILWTGPDALTGAGATTLMSTEEHGWMSPVTAREAALRSALSLKATIGAQLLETNASPSACVALLLPFDLNARALLNHNTHTSSLPASWTLAMAALEADIDSSSADLWANALAPEVSTKALSAPLSLVVRQRTSQSLASLQKYTLQNGGVPAFILETLTTASKALSTCGTRTNGAFASYLARPSNAMPSLANPRYPSASWAVAAPARPALTKGFSAVAHPSSALTLLNLPRTKFTPSSLGFGLDETRLVRTGTSRLADTSLLANKLETLAGPSLTLPSTPVSLLSLGWSTTASLSSYPSYKVARGGLFRRPFTGVSQSARPVTGLKEGFTPLLLGKNSTHLGLPYLTLTQPSTPAFSATAPSLDTQVGAWASVWAVLTPAPTEDLDPTFINATWTPETNTTRRSDHNSRYLVSWSPLLSAITANGTLNPSLSGPSARSSHNTAALRSSLLSVNELGLKNSYGTRGVRHSLLTSILFNTDTAARIPSMLPTSSFRTTNPLVSWTALWGAFPSASSNPFINSATQFKGRTLSGRSAVLMTDRALLSRTGAYAPLSATLGGGDKFNALTDALAKLEFSRAPFGDIGVSPKQGYVPLSSAISVSRRLRVTKGVTLPSDTPMHVICGSKDVIHSWAIPGLNVKIDCVPGYNSHRRLLLRWRGAYWGQCMEVCGRYHHWMPIMINVVHPALFIDWCLTFLRGLDTQAQNGSASVPANEITQLLRLLNN